jgi:CheY-like chemotaxis protein
MDGIEATGIIRGMGYTNKIVALTANALIGRAEMFLKNGFDGFISKPIDSRELNLVLNDFIRNKQSIDTVEAARREHENSRISDLKVFFIRDAENAVDVLGKYSANKFYNMDFELYTTTVHGMKSALANFGEKELSGAALKLEQAGEKRDMAIISGETPVFIDALQLLLKKLKPSEQENAGGVESSDEKLLSEETRIFLCEKLNEIKIACAGYDKKIAKKALHEIKLKTWPAHINSVLDDITVHILHSEFDEAAAVAERIKTNLNV